MRYESITISCHTKFVGETPCYGNTDLNMSDRDLCEHDYTKEWLKSVLGVNEIHTKSGDYGKRPRCHVLVPVDGTTPTLRYNTLSSFLYDGTNTNQYARPICKQS